MKSLPEDEMMNELKHRLTNYTEEPDEDSWSRIAAGLPRRHSWMRPVAVTILVLSYSSLVWMAGNYYGKITSMPASKNESSSTSRSDSAEPDSCKINTTDHAVATDALHSTDSHSSKGSQQATTWRGNNIQNPKPDEVANLAYVKQQFNSALTAERIPGEEKMPGTNEFITAPDTVPSLKDSIVTLKKGGDTVITDKKEPTKVKKFKTVIYAIIGPSLAYQNITPFRQDEVIITQLNSKGIFATDRIGISADAGLQWELSNRWTVFTGLSYYQQNAIISYSSESGTVNAIEPSGKPFNYVLTPEVSTTHQFHYKMRNAGLAAGALYRLQGLKLKHSLGAGLQYQVGLSSQNEQSYTNQGSVYLNYQLLYRIEFILNSRFHFFAQPNYTGALWSKERLNEPFTIDPYRAGIGFGCTYYFQ